MDEPIIFALSAGITLLILFLPVCVTLDGHLDAAARKVSFGIRLYGSVRLAGGYIEPRREGIAVHLSQRKALLFPYGQMLRSRPDLKKLHGFHIKEIRTVTETGNGHASNILVASALLIAGNTAGAVLHTYGCRFRGDVLLSPAENFKITAKIKIGFHLLTVLVLFIKLALEAIITWIEKKQSTT